MYKWNNWQYKNILRNEDIKTVHTWYSEIVFRKIISKINIESKNYEIIFKNVDLIDSYYQLF